ncbi:hypothetical protein ACNR90_005630 [Candidozyma auris]|nr:hypothetical protein QG37_02001 [[Candida] auris]
MAAKTQSTTPFAACAAEVKLVGGIVASKQGMLLFELRGPISVHEPANHKIESPVFVCSLAAMIYQVEASLTNFLTSSSSPAPSPSPFSARPTQACRESTPPHFFAPPIT